jgi:hypothetical protein
MVEVKSKFSQFNMSTRMQVENEQWQEKLQAFTSTNKGRSAAIAALGMTLVENKPFDRVVYDPYGKETISSWRYLVLSTWLMNLSRCT